MKTNEKKQNKEPKLTNERRSSLTYLQGFKEGKAEGLKERFTTAKKTYEMGFQEGKAEGLKKAYETPDLQSWNMGFDKGKAEGLFMLKAQKKNYENIRQETLKEVVVKIGKCKGMYDIGKVFDWAKAKLKEHQVREEKK